jgi:hypothetical protein
MPLRTIIDKILMERWRARQPIVRASRDCDSAVHCIKGMRDIVENPQKHSNLEGHFEFTTRGISVMPNDMLHLCDTPMTKAKLLLEKATKSRAIHLI